MAIIEAIVAGERDPHQPAAKCHRNVRSSRETAIKSLVDTVLAEGSHAIIRIAAPDHPLNLAFGSANTLDPGTGSYQVHGRSITGQDNDDNFTFAPSEQTCNLALLTPAKAIPAEAMPAASPATNNGNSSLVAATVGNASLTLVSGLPVQGAAPNSLAAQPFTLLRESLADIVARAGVIVPPGTSPYKAIGQACGNRTPDCQKILAVRADATGKGTFNAIAPGTYYLMISTRYNNQSLVWSQRVQVAPGPNSLTLDQRNATPVN
jgi:hypothetical protein